MKVWVVPYESPEEGEGPWVDSVFDNEKAAEARAEDNGFGSVWEFELES